MTTISPGASVAEAAAVMARKRVRRLPVTELRGDRPHLLGVISASDILHAFPPDVNPFAVEAPDERQAPQTVGEIMNREVATTTPATPIEEAAAMMRDEKIGALPVMNHSHMVGLITESDIFRAIVSLFSLPGKGARITFDISRDEDVFTFVAQLAKKHGVRVVSLISAEQDNRPECVVRVSGDRIDHFLDDLWASGHIVLNVLQFPITPEK